MINQDASPTNNKLDFVITSVGNQSDTKWRLASALEQAGHE